MCPQITSSSKKYKYSDDLTERYFQPKSEAVHMYLFQEFEFLKICYAVMWILWGSAQGDK